MHTTANLRDVFVHLLHMLNKQSEPLQKLTDSVSKEKTHFAIDTIVVLDYDEGNQVRKNDGVRHNSGG